MENFHAIMRYALASPGHSGLTHWGQVMHICIGNLTIIISDNGLSSCWRQNHCLNQSWHIVNWTLRNKLQWNLNLNSYIFFQENGFQSVVWKMAAILSQPQCVKVTVMMSKRLCYTITPSFHHYINTRQRTFSENILLYTMKLKAVHIIT